MQILTRSASVRGRVREWRDAGQRVALVPTLGTLHKGHMSLVAEAQECADHVIVSIVAEAPAKDGPTLEADRELVANVGAEVLFVPPVQEMYPFGRDSSVSVSLPRLGDLPDGTLRPRSCDALLTVLTKLFHIATPDVALFGERDFRQLVMVRRLVEDFFLPVEIVGCPTFRDGDGLAVASVNRSLTPEERTIAPLLYAALGDMAQRIDGGERDYAGLERQGAQWLNAAGFATDYFVIRQASDLTPARPGTRDLVIMAAARLGSRRLHDSLPVSLIDRF